LSNLKNKSKLILALLIIISAVVIDQLQKELTINYLAANGPQQITSYFNLVMVWNKGVSFGMFNNPATSQWALVALTGAIILLLIYWLKKATARLPVIGFSLVIGGALGNLIDRVYRGAVADFFDFYINNWHWPAFNLADSFIFIGVALLIIDSFKQSDKN